ncbi:MAG: hypothetical protein B6241_03480 [Spirochaetaceae bacterium 4572_59]|nr:MAG: hypothetical protein B6241_03480 [Spirochaetaceae bacterium 4572_59]
MAGPQVSLLLFQSGYTQDGAVFDKVLLSRFYFNPVGWGGTSGIGAEVFTVNQFVYMELRYLREFNSSFRDTGSVYQNTISFSTGMRWETKKR